jgi:hypothetical protein
MKLTKERNKMMTRKIGVLLLIGVVLNWLPKLHAQEWADFYHNGDSIYEAEAYGRIVEDGYLKGYPFTHKSQFETQYFHPDPNVIRHTFSRVRYNASPEEMERYGRLYEEYQQLVTKDNSTNKRVIYVLTEKEGGGTLIFRSFEGNLELKQCKEPYRNDEEVVGDYRFFRRHTEQKVTSAPSWLDPHLADVQEGQLILDACISLGAQMGADLGAELAMAAIPWRVAGQGLWVLKKYPLKILDLLRAAGKYDTPPLSSLSKALELARKAFPNALELPPAVKGKPYPSPPEGVKHWFQIHPPEPGINELPHIKYADWRNGKKNTGGSWGHIFYIE